jgi:hypothetical protein
MGPPSGYTADVRRTLPFAALVLLGLGSGCIIDNPEPLSCGVNADEVLHECRCDNGYDGDPYEGCHPIQTYILTDDCDDGYDIQWRLFSQDDDWQWPAGASSYTTPGFGFDQIEEIQCYDGEWICFGAESNGLEWGVGIDGGLACDDCCYECGAWTVDVGYLAC